MFVFYSVVPNLVFIEGIENHTMPTPNSLAFLIAYLLSDSTYLQLPKAKRKFSSPFFFFFS